MRPAWLKECIWYRPPSMTHRYSDDKLRELASAYRGWYRERFGRDWELALAEPSDVVRTTILQDEKVIGVKDGMPVTVRPVPPAATCAEGCTPPKEGVYKMRVCAPGLYVVSHGGNRLDSFLKASNAKAFATHYLEATP